MGIITGTDKRIFSAGWDIKEIAGTRTNQQVLKEVIPVIQVLPIKQAFVETKLGNKEFPI